MDDSSLCRFIQHYERLTRHASAQLPQRADAVLVLDNDHRIRGLFLKADAGCRSPIR